MKTFNNLLQDNKLSLFIDISTYCNAGCPECHRTDFKSGGLGKVDWLPLVQWSVDEFKQCYEPETIENVRQWNICGTWGDPVMNKDLYEIVDYIYDHNMETNVVIDTNGSIRDEEWWKNLARVNPFNPPVVRFAVEGIDQHMHSRYRRKTSLEKVLNNMRAFSLAGGVAHSNQIVHKHNEPYIEEIKQMCYDNGAVYHSVKYTNRFDFFDGDTFYFKDENNKPDTLELPVGG